MFEWKLKEKKCIHSEDKNCKTYENESLMKIVKDLKQEYKIEQGETKKTILDHLGITKNFLHFYSLIVLLSTSNYNTIAS